jgi:shikimate 5-dehydrogenase
MGYPTHTFKSSLICNPWFEKNGVDAIVVPMGIKAEDYPDFFRSVFTLTDIRGALITMPHKVTTMELVDEISPTAQISGATNAVLRSPCGPISARWTSSGPRGVRCWTCAGPICSRSGERPTDRWLPWPKV